MGTRRTQRTYDHRLVRLVQDSGDAWIAPRLGVPRSTVAGWPRRRAVAFYVDEHNARSPHSAFRGPTPDEMYFGSGDRVPDQLADAREAARRARLNVNRARECAACA